MNKNKNSKIFDLEGKTVVIIGGAGKMGLNFANTLLNANCRVIISDVKNYKISDIQKKLGITSNENLSYMSCDVNDVNQIECMFKKIKDLIGTIDGLIYNVMSKPKGYYKSFEDYDIDTWDNVIRGNLTGAFFSSREASKYMKKNASIILTSSTYGLVGPDQRIYEELDHKTNIYGSRFPLNTPASYVASKAGIIGLVKYLATHLGKFNIRVNALIPGGVFDGQEQAFCERYIERTPLGRMANWSDYNGAIIFLISDASNYMTGANLIIDSGCYNAGFENISILSIAETIQSKLQGVSISITESNDPRSYRQNSDKLLRTGFEQKYNVNDAIDDLIDVYNKGELDEGDHCFTVKWMRHLNLDLK